MQNSFLQHCQFYHFTRVFPWTNSFVCSSQRLAVLARFFSQQMSQRRHLPSTALCSSLIVGMPNFEFTIPICIQNLLFPCQLASLLPSSEQGVQVECPRDSVTACTRKRRTTQSYPIMHCQRCKEQISLASFYCSNRLE
jgi:hypothetical protein